MKKLVFTLLATLLCAAGCQVKELDRPVGEDDSLTMESFYATIEQEDPTKTYIDAARNFRWHKGDEVSAFLHSTAASRYRIEDSADGETSGNFNIVKGGGLIGGTELDASVTYYPYTPSLKVEKLPSTDPDAPDSYLLKGAVLPAVQQYGGERVISKDLLQMVALNREGDNVMRFRNICGVLEIPVKGNGTVSHIVVRGKGGERLCGEAQVTVTDGEAPVLDMVSTKDAGNLFLQCGTDGVVLDPSVPVTFRLALPPTVFKSGFEVLIYQKDGKGMLLSARAGQSVRRSVILKMPEVDFKAGEIEPSPTLPDPVLPPAPDVQQGNNQILYTTTDGKVIDFGYEGLFSKFGAYPISNTYEQGQGVLTFDGDIKFIGIGAFIRMKSLKTISLPKSVKGIERSAFSDCSALTEIMIPEGVVTISHNAFSGCTALSSITIPGSVEHLGEGSGSNHGIFSNCTALETVRINEGVKSIGFKAFSECTGLKDISLPESLDSIGASAFYACSALTTISIPQGVTSIENETFYGCSALTEIMIPEGVVTISPNAFSGCTALSSITIPGSVEHLGEGSDPDQGIFSNCTALETVRINEGVKSIGDNAFSECTGLKDISLPESLDSIGEYAFYNCSSLTELILPQGVQNIADWAMSDCSSLKSIVLPDGLTSINASVFSGCSSLTDISIPESVTSIGYGAFEFCTSLTGLKIPEQVTSIGASAFWGCSALTTISIPQGVTSIENETFYDCSALTSITIPEKVTSIGYIAFSNCTSLTDVTISEGLKNIGDGVFNGCTGLSSINIPQSLESLGVQAFKGCSALTSIIIPEGVKNISDGTFSGCTGLSTIGIPKNLESLGSDAFYDCSALTSITIPEGVRSIGREAFYNCRTLKNIVVPGSVGKLGEDVVPDLEKGIFEDCTALESVVMNTGITSIGSSVFRNCTGLTNVTIPAGVEKIGNKAFANCSSLPTVSLPQELTTIGAYAFEGCSLLSSFTIPENVSSIGHRSLIRCTSLQDVYCRPLVPPVGSPLETAFFASKIYVPVASIDSYKSDPYWSAFDLVRYDYSKNEVVPDPDPEPFPVQFQSTVNWQLGPYSYDGSLDSPVPATARFNGSSISVSVLKLGTLAQVGEAKLTIPAGTKEIGFYAIGWETDIDVKAVFDVNGKITELPIVSNPTLGGSNPYIITVTEAEYHTLNVEGAETVTVRNLEGRKRFVLAGVKVLK